MGQWSGSTPFEDAVELLQACHLQHSAMGQGLSKVEHLPFKHNLSTSKPVLCEQTVGLS